MMMIKNVGRKKVVRARGNPCEHVASVPLVDVGQAMKGAGMAPDAEAPCAVTSHIRWPEENTTNNPKTEPTTQTQSHNTTCNPKYITDNPKQPAVQTASGEYKTGRWGGTGVMEIYNESVSARPSWARLGWGWILRAPWLRGRSAPWGASPSNTAP